MLDHTNQTKSLSGLLTAVGILLLLAVLAVLAMQNFNLRERSGRAALVYHIVLEARTARRLNDLKELCLLKLRQQKLPVSRAQVEGSVLKLTLIAAKHAPLVERALAELFPELESAGRDTSGPRTVIEFRLSAAGRQRVEDELLSGDPYEWLRQALPYLPAGS